MSCIRFSTRAQREQLSATVPVMLTPAEAASQHPAPVMTESKIRRLRLLGADPNPRIRETVAGSCHAPADLLATLAEDADAGVRAGLARNESAPLDILRRLAVDDSETVRGWLALNPSTPAEALPGLASDPSETVRGLVGWRFGHILA
ncbi:MAG: hypothetical protein JWL94_1567 [Microbacteriaceae bacterium]|jgi:hypothetical protein|nr:hypothetical protein [Microbacteriaceae bacterium]HEV7957801.1 hypothetical protein [Marisediminicola sp.]